MQVGVGFAALLTHLLMYFGMPETSHPGTRGIDKMFGGKSKWVWLNPFKCLWFMRSPNLFALVSQNFSALPTTVCKVMGNADPIGTLRTRRSLVPRLFFLTLVRVSQWNKLAILGS